MPNYNNGIMYQNTPYVAQQQQPQQPQQMYMPIIYVNGIEGANAYQMPYGVNKQILWDAEVDSFYVKIIDEMGRPKVAAWKDFFDHVVPKPEPVQQNTVQQPDMSNYITKDYFDKVIGELMVGERGRIVRNNELDA